MSNIKYFLLMSCFSFFLQPYLNAQQNLYDKGLEAINENLVKAQLEFLASDWTEGRKSGTAGAYMAADYIASLFKIYGIKPAGDVEWKTPTFAQRLKGIEPKNFESYFQNFNLLEYEPGELQRLSLFSYDDNSKRSLDFNYKTDFTVSVKSLGEEITAPVVFVGYGYKNDEHNYNDFEDVNVKGKFILRLYGFPGQNDTLSEAYKKFHPEGRYGYYRIMREKDKLASDLGAVGIIEVDPKGEVSNGWESNFPFRFNDDFYEGDKELVGPRKRMMIPGDTLENNISSIRITRRAANEIVKGTGISFLTFEKFAQEKMEPDSKTLKGKEIHFKTTVNSHMIKVRNVLGKIEGENPEEVIVVGAHYDHQGKANGYIWNGSDDNASGTVGMLTLAKAFADAGVKPKKTIIFAAWTGEEEGLLGSKYFVENYESLENIIVNLNYDMISRNSENDSLGIECSMTYTDKYSELKNMAEKYNDELNLGLKINFHGSARPGGGSDHAPFAEKDIPVFYFMAGFHPDYHQPTDHPDKANINKMTKIIKLGFINIWQVAMRQGRLALAN